MDRCRLIPRKLLSPKKRNNTGMSPKGAIFVSGRYRVVVGLSALSTDGYKGDLYQIVNSDTGVVEGETGIYGQALQLAKAYEVLARKEEEDDKPAGTNGAH